MFKQNQDHGRKLNAASRMEGMRGGKKENKNKDTVDFNGDICVLT